MISQEPQTATAALDDYILHTSGMRTHPQHILPQQLGITEVNNP